MIQTQPMARKASSKPADSTAALGFEAKLWLAVGKLEARASQELTRLLDKANQLVAITVTSRKTARGGE